jgi:hypothetical protein
MGSQVSLTMAIMCHTVRVGSERAGAVLKSKEAMVVAEVTWATLLSWLMRRARKCRQQAAGL